SVRALMRLLPELAPATPEILPGLAGSIGDLASSKLYEPLCSFIVLSALVRTLRGELEPSAFNDLTASSPLSTWLSGIEGAWLADIVGSETNADASATVRAW